MKKRVFTKVIFIFVALMSFALCADKFDMSHQNGGIEFDELDNKLTLYFYDALTGKPISGAAFTLGKTKGRTNNSGKVSVPMPDVDKSDTTRFGVFKKRGYITSRVPVRFLVGTVFLHRYSISPTLDPGKMRIVLDWSDKPADLDAHLVKKDANGKKRYHIAYHQMKSYEDRVILDRDDRDGNGPETITILTVDKRGSYSFFIHDYSNRANKRSGALGKSRARVMLFGDGKLMKSFHILPKQGNVWKVFTFKNGEIVIENRVVGSQ